MSPVERFTRDGASKYVWACLALAALIGLAFAFTTGGRAVPPANPASAMAFLSVPVFART